MKSIAIGCKSLLLGQIIEFKMKNEGYNVLLFQDGEALWAQILKKEPDLLIMESELPFLSTKEILYNLNSQKLNVKVIILMENYDENKVVEFFREGAVDCISVPLRIREFSARVQNALSQG